MHPKWQHLLHSDLYDLIAAQPTTDISSADLPRLRARSREAAVAERALRDSTEARDSVRWIEQFVRGVAPGSPAVRILTYTPDGAAPPAGWPCYVSIHGGGFVVGNPDQHDAAHRAIAVRHRAMVVAPAYRLAPESPYPAAIDDCVAVLDWIHGNAAPLGIDPGRVVVGGESAGGGLAAATTLRARARGDLPLAGQILVYPMLDDRTGSARDGGVVTGEFIWTRASNRFAWHAYLGREPGGEDPGYAAPARVQDLSNLPPAHIFVGALDLFRDESIEYARHLIEAGVPASLHVIAGACHAFDLSPLARMTKWFQAAFHDALAQCLSSAHVNCEEGNACFGATP